MALTAAELEGLAKARHEATPVCVHTADGIIHECAEWAHWYAPHIEAIVAARVAEAQAKALESVLALTWNGPVRVTSPDGTSEVKPPTRKVHVRVRDIDAAVAATLRPACPACDLHEHDDNCPVGCPACLCGGAE